MLPPRYRIRVRTTDGIEEHPARTKKEAEDTFRLLMGWDNAQNGQYVGHPESRLYIELQDSGKDRGEFRAIQWSFLHADLEKAAKSGDRDLLDRTLQRLTQKEG